MRMLPFASKYFACQSSGLLLSDWSAQLVASLDHYCALAARNPATPAQNAFGSLSEL